MIGKPANLLVRVRPKYQIRIKIHLGRDAAHRQHTRLIAHVTLYEARDGEDAAPVVRDELANETTVLPYHLALNSQGLEQIEVRVEAPFLDPSSFDCNTMMEMYGIEYCCRCGVCNAACPVMAEHFDDFAGPAALLAEAYRYLDPLDSGDRVMEAVNRGLYRCIQCGTCDQVCASSDIEHLKAWQILRAAAEERGIKPSYA